MSAEQRSNAANRISILVGGVQSDEMGELLAEMSLNMTAEQWDVFFKQMADGRGLEEMLESMANNETCRLWLNENWDIDTEAHGDASTGD